MTRYLLFILVAILPLCTMGQPPLNKVDSLESAMNMRFNSAGKELNKGAVLMGLGWCFLIGSGTLAYLVDNKSADVYVISGLALGLTLNFEGINRIGYASRRIRGK